MVAVFSTHLRLGIEAVPIVQSQMVSNMAKGDWVACYREIKDAKALENYSALATSVIEGAGGRFVFRVEPP